MKKSILLSILGLSSLALVGCNKDITEEAGVKIDKEAMVTVNFYTDFTHCDTKDIIFTIKVQNYNLIPEHPADLTESPFVEFPVFKGWSKKTIINSDADLWNFSTDKVMTAFSTLSLYGIWVEA